MDTFTRTPDSSRHNRNTEYFEGWRPRAAVDLRQAYTFARGVVRAHAVDPGVPGHRIVWVRGASFGSTFLSARANDFAVVGRHTCCSLVLAEDPFVALRHLLVRSIALPSGGIALRVVDLHTGSGFFLPDGSQQTSIFAEGPVGVALGEYALVALPAETKEDELPADLPEARIDASAQLRDQVAALEAAMSPYRANARPVNRVSRITLMPRPVMVGEPLPPVLGRLATGGAYSLTLQRNQLSATVGLAEEDLTRGVIIGRSEKCHSEQLRQVTGTTTSRSHLLVMKDGPVVFAYDLASTVGTFYAGAHARRVVLEDAGTHLLLARGPEQVQLYWRRNG